MKKRRFEVLADLIKQNGWTKGAEVGVFKGATFFHLLDNCPNLYLIGVDNWYANPVPHTKNTTLGLSSWKSPEQMEVYAKDVMDRAEANARATIWRMDSVEAADKVEDGSLDFIFLDAEHTTEAVLSDAAAWTPKVREGGWILGHDEQWESVKRALRQLFPKWTSYSDNVWSFP
jgi:hypothetical protein